MNGSYLTKWEKDIMDLNFRSQVKRGILDWNQVTERKNKIKKQLEKLKLKLNKNKELTDKERNIKFKESFSKLIEKSR